MAEMVNLCNLRPIRRMAHHQIHPFLSVAFCLLIIKQPILQCKEKLPFVVNGEIIISEMTFDQLMCYPDLCSDMIDVSCFLWPPLRSEYYASYCERDCYMLVYIYKIYMPVWEQVVDNPDTTPGPTLLSCAAQYHENQSAVLDVFWEIIKCFQRSHKRPWK